MSFKSARQSGLIGLGRRRSVRQLRFPKATVSGGTAYTSGGYVYRVFTANGSLVISDATLLCDVLSVSGGGGASYGKTGTYYGGAGGAGEVELLANQTLSAATHTVTIGAGGAGAGSSLNVNGGNGTGSQVGSLSAGTGGQGGQYNNGTGGQSGNGFAGGSPNGANTGGGGGATAVGGNATASVGGTGGAGTSTYSSWGVITSTGEDVSGTRYFGGGGGAAYNGVGGDGGGGDSRQAGSANTGGGAGGGEYSVYPGLAGGSGIVIVRYLLSEVS